jgi:hypothetical protein
MGSGKQACLRLTRENRETPFMRSSHRLIAKLKTQRFVSPRKRGRFIDADDDRVREGRLRRPELVAGGVGPSQGLTDKMFPAVIPEGPHPIPSRTRKLRPPGPMVLQGKLCGRVGRRRELSSSPGSHHRGSGLFFARAPAWRSPSTAAWTEGPLDHGWRSCFPSGVSSLARWRPKRAAITCSMQ